MEEFRSFRDELARTLGHNYIADTGFMIVMYNIYYQKCEDVNGVFTLNETENDFCSDTDEMAKSSQCDWLLWIIWIATEIVLHLAQCENTIRHLVHSTATFRNERLKWKWKANSNKPLT